jgi:hypothetical protein
MITNNILNHRSGYYAMKKEVGASCIMLVQWDALNMGSR